MKWKQEMIAGTNVVRPVEDIIHHTTTEACPCAPRVELIGYTCHHEGEKLAIAKQIIHNAMGESDEWDRKENHES